MAKPGTKVAIFLFFISTFFLILLGFYTYSIFSENKAFIENNSGLTSICDELNGFSIIKTQTNQNTLSIIIKNNSPNNNITSITMIPDGGVESKKDILILPSELGSVQFEIQNDQDSFRIYPDNCKNNAKQINI